jgi:hypothetical protein
LIAATESEVALYIPFELFDADAPLTIEAMTDVLEEYYDADYGPIDPWSTNSKQTIWQGHKQFTAGHPQEEHAIASLTFGMKESLREAIRCTISTFETATEKIVLSGKLSSESTKSQAIRKLPRLARRIVTRMGRNRATRDKRDLRGFGATPGRALAKAGDA